MADSLTGTRGDYQVKVRVRNGNIVRRMRQTGFETLKELAEAASVDYVSLNRLVNLRMSATDRNGNWRPWVARIAATLSADPYELFNEQQRLCGMEKTSGEAFLTHAQLETLAGDPIANVESRLSLHRLFECLTGRERLIVECRLDGMTYAEVGSVINTRPERARQIEMRAHTKMKRAARPKMMHLAS